MLLSYGLVLMKKMAVESRCGLEISGYNYKYVQVSHYSEMIRSMLHILDVCDIN